MVFDVRRLVVDEAVHIQLTACTSLQDSLEHVLFVETLFNEGTFNQISVRVFAPVCILLTLCGLEVVKCFVHYNKPHKHTSSMVIQC